MIKYLSVLAVFAATILGGARAESPVLVELFATENCAACPKAYKTLRALDAEREDMLVLTWPVDYWDYLGKADPMALEASKMRQMSYVERFSLRGPYTPQTVYNGLVQCPGNKPKKVLRAMEAAEQKSESEMRFQREGNTIILSNGKRRSADIIRVDFLSEENNETDMVNPVVHIEKIGAWSGPSMMFDTSICEASCALIVQETGQGAVLAAISIDR